MPVIHLEITIDAPIERVFDLCRCIDLHLDSMAGTQERAVEGVTTGLINLGESVTWEAVHFGMRQNLTAKITAFDRPSHFRDSMVSGAFTRFDHDHFFEPRGLATVMRETFDYTAPLWFFGSIADALFLKKYMARLLAGRNEVIKKIAESDGWKKFL